MAINPTLATQVEAQAQEEQQKQNAGIDSAADVAFNAADAGLRSHGAGGANPPPSPETVLPGEAAADATGNGIADVLGSVGEAVGGVVESVGGVLSVLDGL